MTVTYGDEKNQTGVTLTEIYGEARGEVVLPAVWKERPVTALGEALLRGQKQLTAAVIPEGVTSLGWWALAECPRLNRVELPESLIEIGYRGFSGCTALTDLGLPSRLLHLGEASFWGCTSLKRIALPASLTKIRNRTFYGCSQLTDIIIPATLEKIEWGAFEHCKGLRRLTIPEGVSEIGSNALRECAGLKELNFPDGLAAISENLFGRRRLPPLERGYIPNVELSLWEEEAQRILALCYLTTSKRHCAEERRMYEDYILAHRREMLDLAVSLADIPALNGLYELGLPGPKEVDAYIDRANAMRCRDAVASLLEYKHRQGSRVSINDRLRAEFSLDEDFNG